MQASQIYFLLLTQGPCNFLTLVEYESETEIMEKKFLKRYYIIKDAYFKPRVSHKGPL